MDGTRDYPTKCRKSETERQIAYDIIAMCNLKYDTNELIYKTDRLMDIKNRFAVSRGGRKLGVWG